MLTEAQIRNAKPADRPRKVFDGGGLYLEVHPNGSRWWRLKYRINGLEKRLSLGVYPDITLKRARERCQEARRLIAEGVDPSAERKAQKAATEDTFEAIAREYFEMKREGMTPKTYAPSGCSASRSSRSPTRLATDCSGRGSWVPSDP